MPTTDHHPQQPSETQSEAHSDTHSKNPEALVNVDPQELEKFNRLAAQWWDPTGNFKPLHDINPLRANFIEQQLIDSGAGTLAGKKVLDIGCGGGILTEALHHRGAQVTGIDMSKAPLAIAQKHAAEQSLAIDYHLMTAEAHYQQLVESTAEKYDVVTCLEMLEHVPSPASVVDACAKLCKPGGHLFFSTINRNPKSYLFAILGAEYILKMLPKGTHEYAKFIKPSELNLWIRQAKLTTKKMTGLHYNPITKNYWLGDGVSVNYLIHAIRHSSVKNNE